MVILQEVQSVFCITGISWYIGKNARQIYGDVMNNWPFKESENLAVFTSKDIVSQQEWVYYVSHDDEDGAWQFHPFSGFTEEKDACLVSLRHIAEIEPRILELFDLPMGWCAWRDSKSSNWQRKPVED
jgi:hypothetical protein